MPRPNYKKLTQAAEKAFKDFIQCGGCENDGQFLKRQDGCCFYEDKIAGCPWYEWCELKVKVSSNAS